MHTDTLIQGNDSLKYYFSFIITRGLCITHKYEGSENWKKSVVTSAFINVSTIGIFHYPIIGRAEIDSR